MLFIKLNKKIAYINPALIYYCKIVLILITGMFVLNSCQLEKKTVSSVTEEAVLNIYTWVDYIPKEILENFTKETGISINLDVYDNNEMPEAKLLTGHSGYDLVFPTAFPYLPRQIAAGVYEKLDKTKLPLWENLEPDVLKKLEDADPGNIYAIPYLWGVNGIGYDKNCFDQLGIDHPEEKSLQLLFDTELVKKIAPFGISLLDSPMEVFPAVLSYLKLNPNSNDKADLEKAAIVLKRIRPLIRHFSSVRFVNDLANAEIAVAQGWSGDIRLARDQGKSKAAIVFVIPQEGAEMWCDVITIPKRAPHPKNAHVFLNYLLRPEIIAFISNRLGYANANTASKQYLKQEILEDPLVYPPQFDSHNFYVLQPSSPEIERFKNRLWANIKTASQKNV